ELPRSDWRKRVHGGEGAAYVLGVWLPKEDEHKHLPHRADRYPFPSQATGDVPSPAGGGYDI
ncbi:MAG: hypothetical protein FWD90_13380, partial [Defluviitaleaceae bacterium]|nr:hypothetical protein [Defluviitaleaceae bacterium]